MELMCDTVACTHVRVCVWVGRSCELYVCVCVCVCGGQTGGVGGGGRGSLMYC